MDKTTFYQQFKQARRVSTPFVSVVTPDPAATMNTLAALLTNGTEPPIFAWDSVRGMRPRNDKALPVLRELMGEDKREWAGMSATPVDFLTLCADLPERSCTFMVFANRYVDDFRVAQAIWNLRDAYTSTNRTLVLLSSDSPLPPELANDVYVLEEPYPTETELREIVEEEFKAAREASPDIPSPSDEAVVQVVDALTGLPLFPAKQAVALSMRRTGLEIEGVRARKRQTINAQPGLEVYTGGETYADIGGLDNAKDFLLSVLKGKADIRCIAWIDEIDKHIGTMQDSSGVSQAILGLLLTWMQERRTPGVVFVGHPGTSKSLLAKAAGNEAGILTASLDLSGVKGSFVGESERNMRNLLRTLDAVAQGKVFFIATSNAFKAIPAPLRRRFKLGTFFFDLPDETERGAIWSLNLRKFGLEAQELPPSHNWTGAEIATCCEYASMTGVSLVEAGKNIIPLAASAREEVEALRQQADGRYRSANYPGVYNIPQTAVGGNRRYAE